jgi:hypothetical protein
VVTLDSVLTLPAAVAGAVRLGQRGTGDGRGELSGWIVAAPDPKLKTGS